MIAQDAELDAELMRLEGRVLAGWIAGPAFRSRYTPDPAAYWNVRNQSIARACQTMARLGVTPWGNGDLGMALITQLTATGELTKLWPLGESPLPPDVVRDPDTDLARLLEVAALRRLQRELQRIASTVTSKSALADTRSAVVEALGQATVGTPIQAYSQADGMARVLMGLNTKKASGLTAGLPTLDSLVGGVRPGHVWVVGAPTNWGKTSLCLAIADMYPKRSLIVTCEDDPDLLFSRLLARRSGVSGTAIRDCEIDPRDHTGLIEVVSKADRAAPFVVDGRGKSVERIADYIRVITAAHDIGLVFADYLQCISTERKTDDRRHEINHVARTLTDAIKTRGCAGILTSQVTDEAVRDSRDVEHAAEVVLIGRKAPSGLSLYLKKNKSGPADTTIDLQMNRNTGAMYERQQAFQSSEPYDNERIYP